MTHFGWNLNALVLQCIVMGALVIRWLCDNQVTPLCVHHMCECLQLNITTDTETQRSHNTIYAPHCQQPSGERTTLAYHRERANVQVINVLTEVAGQWHSSLTTMGSWSGRKVGDVCLEGWGLRLEESGEKWVGKDLVLGWISPCWSVMASDVVYLWAEGEEGLVVWCFPVSLVPAWHISRVSSRKFSLGGKLIG